MELPILIQCPLGILDGDSVILPWVVIWAGPCVIDHTGRIGELSFSTAPEKDRGLDRTKAEKNSTKYAARRYSSWCWNCL